MKLFSKSLLAVATVSVMSLPVGAQTPANVTVNISNLNNQADWVARANPAGFSTIGGGWRATVTGIPKALTVPQDLILYCFDSQRQFAYNTNMNYTLLSFGDFLSNAGVVDGLRAAQWDQINVLDLNYMVERASGYDMTGAITANNNTRQTDIWNTSNNGAASASPFNKAANAYSNSWMILVDRNEWANGNGAAIDGRQSFLVQIGGGGTVVPEPSTYALMGAGLVALFAVSRRRRNTVA
ncbi:PEP-CTERM sorting domain-containing protein [Gemmatimonas phototrophica]|uniref:Ice-binding protein C-terminal domain-containing protein n=1 Tax=Gemmatimonas phototrophica TaxID=1379270 RepID=A0A143BGJ1_9BACT|nr:PEP-CTERM sorting domain-containing protein [Gemmatimonas phototrophica]AMW04166.1 hypothetical protein GEMMAAP_03610 [Gemmatimonas phototrophica]